MKVALFIVTLVGTALGGVVEGRDGCDADNCLRAVRETRFGTQTLAAHSADCSSFNKVTVYIYK